MQGMNEAMNDLEQKLEQTVSANIPAPDASVTNRMDRMQTALGDGVSLAAQLEESKPRYALAMLKGGTVLGSAFAVASPFLQAVKPASRWEAFKTIAPKAGGLGFVVGAAGSGISTMVQRAGIERLKQAYSENSERGR